MTPLYDIHCHVFNKNVLVRKLVNIVQTLLMLQNLVEQKISGEEMKCRIEGILTTLDEVTKPTSEEVFRYLNDHYQGQLTIVPLMFDLTYVDNNDGDLHQNKQFKRRIQSALRIVETFLPVIKALIKKNYPDINWDSMVNTLQENINHLINKIKKGSSDDLALFDEANYQQQIIELEQMAGKYPNMKPFFGIDPRREYKGGPQLLSTVIEKVLKPGAHFAGLKLYAPAGFSPTDQLLMGSDVQEGVYALCERHSIPITVHNSNAGFACFSKYLRVNGHIFRNGKVEAIDGTITFDKEFLGIENNGLKPHATTGEAIHERASKLNHPQLWKLVLEKYPNLNINFAHFGGSGQIMEYVHYNIPLKTFTLKRFDELVEQAGPREKSLLQSHYQKSGRLMKLNEQLPFNERAKLWNAMYSMKLIDNWAKAIFDLIRDPNHPNAYTDLSCFSESQFIQETSGGEQAHFSIRSSLNEFKAHFFDKINPYEQSKFLYGSDFFLAQFFGPTMENYYRDFKAVFGTEFELIAGENPHRFLSNIRKEITPTS